VHGVEAAAAAELVVDGGAGGRVRLPPQVEPPAVAELLLAVDQQRQRDGLLPVAQQRRRQGLTHRLGHVVAPGAVPVEDAAEDGCPPGTRTPDKDTIQFTNFYKMTVWNEKEFFFVLVEIHQTSSSLNSVMMILYYG
jgi:hypothetical protein